MHFQQLIPPAGHQPRLFQQFPLGREHGLYRRITSPFRHFPAILIEREPVLPYEVSMQVLVQRHVEHTGSTVGSALLEDWAVSAARFTKVMPRDYKAVLLARSRALEAGFADDSQETLDAIMEASRG